MTNVNVAWSCPECGRIEAPATEKYCPTCATKMQRCSRYEWCPQLVSNPDLAAGVPLPRATPQKLATLPMERRLP